MTAREDLETLVAAELRASATTTAAAADGLAPSIATVAKAIATALSRGGKLLIAGNGGSAADAQHMAAEIVGRFRRERAAAPAIALVDNPATVTAIANDYDFARVFSRQVEAFGRTGDALLAISTSGRSENVIEAVRTGSAQGLRTIALTGGDGGELASEADLAIVVGAKQTARIQEAHLTIMHAICEVVDASLEAVGDATPKGGASRVLSRPEIMSAREEWRDAGLTIVWTNGCFDLLHAGHVRFLEQARSLGDMLAVGVNSDQSVREIKGRDRPIVPEEERAEVIAALRSVDAVTVFPETTPIAILEQLQPDVHCKGGDYSDPTVLPETETVQAYGGRVEILDLMPGRSTSELVKRARLEGNVA